jgi:hypothetical protein
MPTATVDFVNCVDGCVDGRTGLDRRMNGATKIVCHVDKEMCARTGRDITQMMIEEVMGALRGDDTESPRPVEFAFATYPRGDAATRQASTGVTDPVSELGTMSRHSSSAGEWNSHVPELVATGCKRWRKDIKESEHRPGSTQYL